MIGQTLAHYRIQELLGKGGMGEVYRALDTRLDREVALKILPPGMADSGDRLGRFRREAKAVAALNHPCIVTIYSVEELADRPFFTMELVRGETLARVISRGPLELERLLAIAVPLADALAAAHEQGITHRDLKPGNIMIGEGGRVKVLDFGLAKLTKAPSGEADSELPTEMLTREGRLLGTVAYMSPEQVRGASVDHRSDIFSLGIVLFEMATGERPFTGQGPSEIISALLRDQPRSLGELRPDLPRQLERVVGTCLEREPERRYQATRDVCIGLEGIRRESELDGAAPSRTAPPKIPWRGRMRRKPGLATLGLVLLVVLFYLGSRALGPLARLEERPGPPAAQDRKVIAVLPFKNLGEADDRYFASGITEELTSRLAGVSGLGVIAHTSSRRYGDERPNLARIASELGAGYFLEGTVRWQREPDGKSRVRITPRLIRAADAIQLWSATYDRELVDIFAIQAELSEKVVESLNVTLAAGERQSLAARPTGDMEAYKVYLRGIELASDPDRAKESLAEAIEILERATRMDPGFVPAWERLSRALSQLYGFYRPEPELRERARAATRKVSELAPDEPPSHLAQGFFHYYVLRDLARGLAEFRLAERQLPNDAEAAAAIGYILRRQGKFEEAAASLRRAVEVNPLDAGMLWNLALTLQFLGRYEEADGQFASSIALVPEQAASYFRRAWNYVLWKGDTRRARELVAEIPEKNEAEVAIALARIDFLDRDFAAVVERIRATRFDSPDDGIRMRLLAAEAQLHLGRTEEARANAEEALKLLEGALRQAPDDPDYRAGLGRANALLGRRKQALEESVRIGSLPSFEDALVSPRLVLDQAAISALAGDSEGALDRLRHLSTLAFGSSASKASLGLDPTWDGLRDHREFQELLARFRTPVESSKRQLEEARRER